MPRDTRSTPTLASPLRDVLGERTAIRLRDKLDLPTVADLLRYYPRRYDERGQLTDLAELVVGERATVWGRVSAVNMRQLSARPGRPRRGPRNITTVTVTDGRRSVTCTFFNQPWLRDSLAPGTEALFSGKVGMFNGVLQLASPQVATDRALGGPDGMLDLLESFPGGLIPVYPQVEGVTSSLVQRSVKQVLDILGFIADPVPDSLVADRGLVALDAALRDVHRPRGRDELDRALRRLAYDEALTVQLELARRRARSRTTPAVPCVRRADRTLAAFEDRLPFRLTEGQRQVGEVIAGDLAKAHPMNRLLQGEVGSGKTVVALRAMLQVTDAGRQAALLAPTEVLAAQHARSLRAVLGPLGRAGELDADPAAVPIRLLTGSSSTTARRAALAEITSGAPGIVVGTHALLGDRVQFGNLGLVVVDEQHRFGVQQRSALSEVAADAAPPHVLVMTATPIPRTVAMTVFGDLDVSALTELPAGRSPVSTTVVPAAEKPGWLDRAWRRVTEEVAGGRQAFVVCPKIGDDDVETSEDGTDLESDDGAAGAEDGERPPLHAVLSLAAELSAGPLAGLRLAVLHGRLPPAEKDAVMRSFSAGDVDVLVATTVVEVGVDVPNATAMVIMDADRFGVSQLHQLRGRIGRGSLPGVCLLVTNGFPGTPGRARLDAVAATTDGFELAEADLVLRREGDVLGANQSGRSTSLRALSVLRDRELIATARADAAALVGDDPSLSRYPALAAMADHVLAGDSREFAHKA